MLPPPSAISAVAGQLAQVPQRGDVELHRRPEAVERPRPRAPPWPPMPALLTSTSRRPSVSTVVATRRSRSSGVGQVGGDDERARRARRPAPPAGRPAAPPARPGRRRREHAGEAVAEPRRRPGDDGHLAVEAEQAERIERWSWAGSVGRDRRPNFHCSSAPIVPKNTVTPVATACREDRPHHEDDRSPAPPGATVRRRRPRRIHPRSASALLVSLFAAIGAVVVDALTDVPTVAILAVVVVIGFALSWHATGHARPGTAAADPA